MKLNDSTYQNLIKSRGILQYWHNVSNSTTMDETNAQPEQQQ